MLVQEHLEIPTIIEGSDVRRSHRSKLPSFIEDSTISESAMSATTTQAPLTEAEVKAFVEDWYLVKLDQHVPPDVITPMVMANVDFVLPETSFTGRDKFQEWYERIINSFFDEVHTITSLEITPHGDHADVKVVVNWQTKVWEKPAPKSKWLGFDAYQTWTVVRSPETGKAAIQKYVVDRFEPMSGSAPLG